MSNLCTGEPSMLFIIGQHYVWEKICTIYKWPTQAYTMSKKTVHGPKIELVHAQCALSGHGLHSTPQTALIMHFSVYTKPKVRPAAKGKKKHVVAQSNKNEEIQQQDNSQTLMFPYLFISYLIFIPRDQKHLQKCWNNNLMHYIRTYIACTTQT